MKPRFGLSIVVLSVLLVARAATAGDRSIDERAEQAFAMGEAAFAANDFRRAAEQFEEAYRLSPHYAPLWNAARAWHRVGERARAANLYARYLREATDDAKDRPGARAALLEIQPSLGQLELPRADFDAIFVDAKPVDAPVLYVEPGVHVIVGRKDGRETNATITLARGQVAAVRLTLDAKANAAPEPSQPSALAPEAARKPLSPWVAVAGAVVTAAAGGLFIASGLDTKSFKDERWNSVPERDRTQAVIDDGLDKQLRTNILLGVTCGAALATTAISVLFVDWGGRPTTSAAKRTGPSVRARAGLTAFAIEGAF